MSEQHQDSGDDSARAEAAESALAENSAAEPLTMQSIRGWAREWLLSLFDIRFHRSMVLHALPAVYVVMIGGGAIYTLYVIGAAFTASLGKGVIWIFLGPIVYLVGLSLLRAVLEFFAAVLQMAARVQTMQGDMEDIAAVPRLLRGLNPLAGKDNG